MSRHVGLQQAGLFQLNEMQESMAALGRETSVEEDEQLDAYVQHFRLQAMCKVAAEKEGWKPGTAAGVWRVWVGRSGTGGMDIQLPVIVEGW